VGSVVEDSVWRREHARPQPGLRPAAPGELAVFQAFLNSHFDLGDNWGADLLATPPGLAAWLADRTLIAPEDRLDERAVDRALTVRDSLRGLIASGGADSGARTLGPLNGAVAGASLELRFSEAGLRLVPVGAEPLDRAMGTLLAIAAGAMFDGTWSRLKSCPGHHCGWTFYDRSRNNSGRWCSMKVCGGREKARAHYHRHRDS
jgi:predicted RNA-binding Zn ribbon-like protein